MMEGREKPGMGASEEDLQQYLHRLCSDVTLFNREEGFFTHFIEQIDAQVSDSFYKKFATWKTDEERVLDAWSIKPVHTLNIQSFYKKKNSDQAEYHRKKGNTAFQNKDYTEALVMYTRAVLQAPNNSEECLSLSYANRSAVLYHVEFYQQCLDDIDLAVEAGYPSNLMYKVLDRRGQALVKLGQYSKAQEAFQDAEKALADSTLDEKKMESWRKDINKKREFCQGKKDKVRKKEPEADDSLFGGASAALPNASVALTIQESKEAGRYAEVTRPVGTGQVLIAEDPYAAVITSERYCTHCIHCFKRLVAPVACKYCATVAFCSRECRDKALSTYHRWECKFLDLFVGSGMSLNCFLAVRIITQHDLEYFKAIQPLLKDPSALPSETNPHCPDDYLSIYHMVSLEEQRPPEDFLKRALMACYLLKALQRMDYFGRWDDEGPPDKALTENELFIGGLLLKHLQILQFNSHEITSLAYQKDVVNFKETLNIKLGLAVYPTVSFCNHSCYPAVARYFKGAKMVVMNVRPLGRGDMVAENYGPVFTHHDLQQRRRKLLSRYWFKCECDACRGNWPVYDAMALKRKLRCQSCSHSLNLMDPKKTQVKCPGCSTHTDVKEALAIIAKAEDVYLSGKMHMEANEREEAIKFYTAYSDTICKYCNPPVKELHRALDALRLLFAAKGTIQTRSPLAK